MQPEGVDHQDLTRLNIAQIRRVDQIESARLRSHHIRIAKLPET